MSGISPNANGAEDPPGRRSQNRISQTQRFLEAGLAIVDSEGLHGLTMSKLARQSGAAVGAVYRYFPSKGALVAEMQRHAIDRIAASYVDYVQQFRSSELLAKVPNDEQAQLVELAGLWLVSEFYCQAAVLFAEEFRLLQLLMAETHAVVPIEEGFAVLPHAMALLSKIAEPIDAAVAAGAIEAESTLDRVLTLTAAAGSLLQVARLAVYDEQLFEPRRLVMQLSRDLFRGWGADETSLSGSARLVQDFADACQLVR